jgi:DNA polymerase-3 subunit gamma/tau
MEQFVVSARKYRPATFETVVGQDTISTTLKNAIQRKQLAHAYLFCGPRGVGKTTCARIFAKTINCLQPTADMEACGVCESCLSFAEGRSYSIHELDAASNNSVEDIRILTEQVRVPPQIGQYSVYIIDEVHMLSSAAFNAFLKTLEEPPSYAIFILATTEKHKVLPTILSRCQIYDFNRIRVDSMEKYLKTIAQKENVTVEDAALNVIAQKADGALRDALSLFDQAVVFCGNTLTYDAIIQNLHVVDYKYYFTFTDHFLEHRYAQALALFDEVLAKGFDALHFVAGLSEHFRDLLVCKDPVTLKLFESGEAFKKDCLEQAARCTVDFLFDALAITNACEMSYKSSGNPRLHVELALLRLSNIGLEKKSKEQNEPIGEPSAPAHKPVAAPAAPTKKEAPKEEKPAPTSPPPPPPPPPSHSLKQALTEKPRQEEETPATSSQRTTPFNQEQLLEAWQKLRAQTASSRLADALDAANPLLEDGYKVACSVVSPSQKEWLEKTMAQDIIPFLRNELQNDLVNIEAAVTPPSENDDPGKNLYMPEQRFNFLRETHPQVEKLKQTLGLDIK